MPWLSNSNSHMDLCRRPQKILYKLRRNSDLSGAEDFVGQHDEDEGTENEICTVASARLDSEGGNSVSTSRSDKMEETFTVDDVLETIGFGKFQVKLSLFTGLLWTGDAMEMTLLSILGPQLHCEWRLPSYQVAIITSVVFVGTAIGAPVFGNVFDKYGRRVGLMICMCWILYYALLSTLAPTYGWLLFLRGLVGFGIGGTPQAVTLYSEFLPKKMRGTCIILQGIYWAVGTVFVVLLAMWIMPTLGWRWLLGVCTLPLAILVCFFFWLPESPHFDLMTGNTEKAMATLKGIAKENGKPMPQGKVTAHKQKHRGQIKDLFAPRCWKTTLLLWFIWFALAFSYYGIVLLTTELFGAGESCGTTQGAKAEHSCTRECKFLTSTDYKDILWTTLAEFPSSLCGLLLVDRIGRKKSMALSFFVFSFFILPLYACIGRVALTVFIFIARAFITGGFQVVFVYTPEVFPTENRALALGTCSAIARVGSLITPFVSQVMLEKSMHLALSMYVGCCLLAGIASLILPIETLGMDLQESNLNQNVGVQTK